MKPSNFTNQFAYAGSSSFLRTEEYQFNALIVFRYAQTPRNVSCFSVNISV